MKRKPLRLILGRLDSPVGQVLTATDADGVLRALDFTTTRTGCGGS